MCNEVRISIMCSDGRFNIPFSIPGCVSNLNMVVGNNYISGKNTDLSKLGCDMTEWRNIKILNQNKTFQILIDGEQVYKLRYKSDPGKIVGLRYKFNGLGEVKDVRLTSGDGLVLIQGLYK